MTVAVRCTELSNDDREQIFRAYEELIALRSAATAARELPESVPFLQTAKSAYFTSLFTQAEELAARVRMIFNAALERGKKDYPFQVFCDKICLNFKHVAAQLHAGDDHTAVVQKLEQAYEGAQTAATTFLENPTNPDRLGLALNFSVFCYEILKSPVKARKLAKQAFDAAIDNLDMLDEDSYKDSTLIMQLLRDKLTLWTSDSADAN
ncbi:14-3-3 protein zeta/delta [Aphelenchoides fujianensis]|nr:14-3-3 protein zeta/delta [Aphelenchoides fujianensis]